MFSVVPPLTGCRILELDGRPSSPFHTSTVTLGRSACMATTPPVASTSGEAEQPEKTAISY